MSKDKKAKGKVMRVNESGIPPKLERLLLDLAAQEALNRVNTLGPATDELWASIRVRRSMASVLIKKHYERLFELLIAAKMLDVSYEEDDGDRYIAFEPTQFYIRDGLGITVICDEITECSAEFPTFGTWGKRDEGVFSTAMKVTTAQIDKNRAEIVDIAKRHGAGIAIIDLSKNSPKGLECVKGYTPHTESTDWVSINGQPTHPDLEYRIMISMCPEATGVTEDQSLSHVLMLGFPTQIEANKCEAELSALLEKEEPHIWRIASGNPFESKPPPLTVIK